MFACRWEDGGEGCVSVLVRMSCVCSWGGHECVYVYACRWEGGGEGCVFVLVRMSYVLKGRT